MKRAAAARVAAASVGALPPALRRAAPLAALAIQLHAAAAPAVLDWKSIALAPALQAAQAAMAACTKQGALVAVAVVDRGGQLLVSLRDPLAGPHTSDAAARKAWTALSFRNATSALERATAVSSESNGIRQLPGVAMIAGGVPIAAAGQQVGAIGVSGAPSGAMDEACAAEGVRSITADLELGS